MADAYTGEHGKEFLHAQIKALLSFYDPIVRDDELGGFNNQLRDDGTVYDKNTKHAVGTARFTVNYALASMLYGEPAHKDLCAHGVKFLMERQLDHEHGGFAWVLNGHTVQDGDKWCYSVAFSLLALANAHRAGVEGAAAHIATVHALAEEKYYEPAHGLYVDSFPRDFSAPAAYRGQNANMHMCEAQVRRALTLAVGPPLEPS
jgi:mannose/cellobiose epimerase-like protein (N-acyl-D-glucosamine 2-epimerase family)